MIGNCDFREIKHQMEFCNELVAKLKKDIDSSKEGSWSGMENHTRKQDDIK